MQRLLAVVIVLFAGCTTFPMKDSAPYTSGPKNRPIPHWYAESTSAIIPSGGPRSDSDCPTGRMIVVSGSGAAGDTANPAIFLRNFGDSAEDIKPLDHAKIAGLTAKDDLTISGDNMLVRRANGDLVLVWLGITWDAFPGTPPAWAGIDPRNNGRIGERAAIYTFVSSDCGNSWSALTEVDSGDTGLLNAELGVPRGGWFGGFDREEVYADPFTGNIFMTVSSVSGGHPSIPSEPIRFHMLLFVLRPGAPKWDLLTFFEASGSNAGTFENTNVPMVMTTTAEGRLYLAQCVGGAVKLYWMDAGAIAIGSETLSGKMHVVKAGEGKDCAIVPGGTFPGNFNSYHASWPLISRWYGAGTGGVRIAYPIVEQGRQLVRIMQVDDLSEPQISAGELTTLSKPGPLSIVQGAFIENDPTELQTSTDVTAMYWLAADKETMRAEYMIWRGPAFEPVRSLAVNNGQPVTWVPKLYNTWAGDYIRGASYADQGKFFYFMQWPQSDAAAAHPNSNLHYRVVAAKP
jgi:hypothetical protein